jgi:hypothetical protein
MNLYCRFDVSLNGETKYTVWTKKLFDTSAVEAYFASYTRQAV